MSICITEQQQQQQRAMGKSDVGCRCGRGAPCVEATEVAEPQEDEAFGGALAARADCLVGDAWSNGFGRLPHTHQNAYSETDKPWNAKPGIENLFKRCALFSLGVV
eukprot:1901372-Amphidinium_carterae.1